LNLQLNLLGDDLGLTFSYLYYYVFGVKWSGTVLGDQHWNSFNFLVKRLWSITFKWHGRL